MSYKSIVDLDDNFEKALSLLYKEVEGSRFKGEELSILTHFLNSGLMFPKVSSSIYDKIRYCFELETRKNEAKFNFADLFSGIGGFRLGLQEFGGRSVFSSEWEKHARNSYYLNYGDYPFGNIELFTNDCISDKQLDCLIPHHDVLAAGFPCQPFSNAGVSARNSLGIPHGFNCTTQGTLFYSIERIASVKRPKILFLENVRNILSHDRGKTFSIIQSSIEKLDYKFFYKIINSESVVAQRRVRCFIVAIRDDVHDRKGDFTFPNFEGEPLALKDILEDLPVDDIFTISDKLWVGHKERSARNKARGTGFTAGLADLCKPSNTIVARYGKDGKECLIPQKGKNPRMLTLNECKKLFGYPKNFILPKSRTPAYKLMGNSVVVPVVSKIAEKFVSQYL